MRIMLDVTLFVLSICVSGVVCDVSNANPPVGSCLCFTTGNVNVRDAPCGSVLGQANINQCFRYTGSSTLCTLGSSQYRFFGLKQFSGAQDGHSAGNFLEERDGGQCDTDHVTGTTLSNGACLQTTTTVNMRSTACGSVSASVPSGSAATYSGEKQICTFSGGSTYEYIKVNALGQTGYIASPYLKLVACSQSTDFTLYGNIMLLSPTGASQATATGYGHPELSGVAASNAIVRDDFEDIAERWNIYQQAGENQNIDPALLAAIASRESRAGRVIESTNGYGDNGNGFGIMQCDINTGGVPCESVSWDSYGHVLMVTRDILIPKIECVQGKKVDWTKEQQLQGGVAAYNFGCGNVWSWSNLDGGSTGNDYSNDVIARAQYIKNNMADLLALIP